MCSHHCSKYRRKPQCSNFREWRLDLKCLRFYDLPARRDTGETDAMTGETKQNETE
jgi:hypothetical protein